MPEIKNEFAWSWSRHGTFYECARKTYWQHYGFWGGWGDEASKETSLAYRLKQLKNLAMVVGEAVHEVIRERLLMRTDGPCGVPAEQMQDEVERRVMKRMRESRNRDWERFSDPKHYAMLFEDYYGPGVSEPAQSDALQKVRACVEGFAANGFGRRSFATAKENLHLIDSAGFDQRKTRIDGTIVYAAPDLVVKGKNGDLHVIDWKTGQARKANMAQLAVYGLYVSEKFGVPIDRISAHIIYLNSGEVQTLEHLAEGIEEARRMVSTYTTDIRGRLTDVTNNLAGDMSKFPMTENLALCRRCNYRELCGRCGEPALVPDSEDTD